MRPQAGPSPSPSGGVYWALGGTLGLGTLSPSIQRAAADHDPSLFAALWITVAIELGGVVLALALAMPRRDEPLRLWPLASSPVFAPRSLARG